MRQTARLETDNTDTGSASLFSNYVSAATRIANVEQSIAESLGGDDEPIQTSPEFDEFMQRVRATGNE